MAHARATPEYHRSRPSLPPPAEFVRYSDPLPHAIELSGLLQGRLEITSSTGAASSAAVSRPAPISTARSGPRMPTASSRMRICEPVAEVQCNDSVTDYRQHASHRHHGDHGLWRAQHRMPEHYRRRVHRETVDFVDPCAQELSVVILLIKQRVRGAPGDGSHPAGADRKSRLEPLALPWVLLRWHGD